MTADAAVTMSEPEPEAEPEPAMATTETEIPCRGGRLVLEHYADPVRHQPPPARHHAPRAARFCRGHDNSPSSLIFADPPRGCRSWSAPTAWR